MLSFLPRDVLNEIWDLIGSVSEGFPTYSCNKYDKITLIIITIIISIEYDFAQ